jgi:hypothetical protein
MTLYIADETDPFTGEPVMTLQAGSISKPRARNEGHRIILIALACAAIIIVLALLSKQFPTRSPARIACALLQGVASAIVVVVTLRDIHRLDELQQRVHLEALALAFAGTAILSTGYGFLIKAGLPNIEWAAVVWPVMVGLWAVGLVVASRRYR